MKFLWGLLNMTQIVTFSPLMGLSPPGFVLAFFRKLNFVNMEIFIEEQSIINKIRFIQTFKSWNKNFSMIGLVLQLFEGRLYLIPVIFLAIVLLILALIYICKSTK